MDTIRWGILATGGIAHKLAQALADQPDAELAAVGSRSQASADAFGEQWGIPRRHGSYEALVNDPDVDVIYIATPHSFHYENMLLCLNAGKHVLCEKPLTLNADEARQCIALARDKKLFLMEAMWTRFLPAMVQVRAWLDEGAIGTVRVVQASFALFFDYDPEHRLYAPELGGGALLDLGVYPISFAAMVLGLPDRTLSHTFLSPTGVDELNSMIFTYDTGATALLMSSQRLDLPVEAFVGGTEGYIKVHAPFFKASDLTLYVDGKEQTVEKPFESNGYIHQVREVHQCLREGKLESAIMPLDETAAIMGLMDDLRHEWGFAYPGER